MQAKNHNRLAAMATTLVICWSAQARCLGRTGDGDHWYTATMSLVLISVR